MFDAALSMSAALLFGCESWLGADLKPVTKLYNWAIKQLLVRTSVVPRQDIPHSLPDLLRLRQQRFFKKMESERCGQADDPLMYTIDVCCHASKHCNEY